MCKWREERFVFYVGIQIISRQKLLQKTVITVAKAIHFNNHSKIYSNKVKMACKIKKRLH